MQGHYIPSLKPVSLHNVKSVSERHDADEHADVDRRVFDHRLVTTSGHYSGRERCQHIGVHADAVEKPLQWIPTDVRRISSSRAQRHGGQLIPVGESTCRQLHRHRRVAIRFSKCVYCLVFFSFYFPYSRVINLKKKSLNVYFYARIYEKCRYYVF